VLEKECYSKEEGLILRGFFPCRFEVGFYGA
jgi:hypothetical protein